MQRDNVVHIKESEIKALEEKCKKEGREEIAGEISNLIQKMDILLRCLQDLYNRHD
jgi:hypothetical protein